MHKPPIRVLVVDDYDPWRQYVSTTLCRQDGIQVVGEVADGLEAVHKAEELQPELILLDIGLPTLNGIEAARKIREVSPSSKILFVSENRDWDIAQEALRAGGQGYVVKSDAGELLSAIKAVLQRKEYLSASLAGHHFTRERIDDSFPHPQHHEVAFYSDDRFFIDKLAQFIATALKAGNAAIAVLTLSHQSAVIAKLQAHGSDIGAAIEQGRFIALDAANAVSMFMDNDLPDPDRFLQLADNLVTTLRKSTTVHPRRVVLCGECDPPLWTLGNGEAAIRLEQLWNLIAARYEVDILCAYSLPSPGFMDSFLFGRICAQHSAVHTW